MLGVYLKCIDKLTSVNIPRGAVIEGYKKRMWRDKGEEYTIVGFGEKEDVKVVGNRQEFENITGVVLDPLKACGQKKKGKTIEELTSNDLIIAAIEERRRRKVLGCYKDFSELFYIKGEYSYATHVEGNRLKKDDADCESKEEIIRYLHQNALTMKGKASISKKGVSLKNKKGTTSKNKKGVSLKNKKGKQLRNKKGYLLLKRKRTGFNINILGNRYYHKRIQKGLLKKRDVYKSNWRFGAGRTSMYFQGVLDVVGRQEGYVLTQQEADYLRQWITIMSAMLECVLVTQLVFLYCTMKKLKKGLKRRSNKQLKRNKKLGVRQLSRKRNIKKIIGSPRNASRSKKRMGAEYLELKKRCRLERLLTWFTMRPFWKKKLTGKKTLRRRYRRWKMLFKKLNQEKLNKFKNLEDQPSLERERLILEAKRLRDFKAKTKVKQSSSFGRKGKVNRKAKAKAKAKARAKAKVIAEIKAKNQIKDRINEKLSNYNVQSKDNFKEKLTVMLKDLLAKQKNNKKGGDSKKAKEVDKYKKQINFSKLGKVMNKTIQVRRKKEGKKPYPVNRYTKEGNKMVLLRGTTVGAYVYYIQSVKPAVKNLRLKLSEKTEKRSNTEESIRELRKSLLKRLPGILAATVGIKSKKELYFYITLLSIIKKLTLEEQKWNYAFNRHSGLNYSFFTMVDRMRDSRRMTTTKRVYPRRNYKRV